MRPLLRKVSRWAVLGIVFTAVVMAATPVEDNTGEDSTAQMSRDSIQPVNTAVSPARMQASPPPLETVHVELERLARPHKGAEMKIGKVFDATSWYVPPPPPPPAPPAPPPVPTAPPLPFAYLGRYEDAPTQLVFLVKGERMYTVAEGEVIDGTYRVARVTKGMVELTYLPLNITQTLSTGETL
jgi:hypothetical protein